MLLENQCGFRLGNGAVDMTFSLRQLQEKTGEQNIDLYVAFVDLTKALHTVSRDALWTVIRKFAIPGQMLNGIVSFHEEIMASVRSDDE